MLTLAQFIATENGQALDYDGIPADTGQCVQLVAYYCQNVLGVTPPALNAVDWWNDYGSEPSLVNNFDRIAYSPSNLPKKGDIVVFGASNAINSPLYGHIDIAIADGTASGYIGFDSNWGGDYNAQGYPVAHQVAHSYMDVLGYLRPKGDNTSMNPTAQQAHDTIMAFETENDNVTPHQPTQADLNYAVSTPWPAWIVNFYPMVQKLRDTISLLQSDRDNNLYPTINAATSALGLPASATAADITAAIEALKSQQPAAVNKQVVESYIAENLS
jgi:CHAP domain